MPACMDYRNAVTEVRLYASPGDAYEPMNALSDVLSKLGPRDPTFVFGTVRQSSRNPHTHFPDNYHTDGDCVVDIQVGKRPWENLWRDQGTWQVAHECVHLLDPVERGAANFLEEGLATWFQDELLFHDDNVKRYIARNSPPPEPYSTAKRLVVQCQPQIVPVVKKIRSSGTRIRDSREKTLALVYVHGHIVG